LHPLLHPQNDDPAHYHVFHIGHAIWGLVVGWLGGHFTAYPYERRVRE
jgi:hypothetical protein